MSYDHWKTTNPEDEWLGPDPHNEPEEDEPKRWPCACGWFAVCDENCCGWWNDPWKR